MLAAARGWRGPGPLVLVTHQVNISALTGEGPAMGEAFILSFPQFGQYLHKPLTGAAEDQTTD